MKTLPFKRRRRVPRYPVIDLADVPLLEQPMPPDNIFLSPPSLLLYLDCVSRYFRRLAEEQVDQVEKTYRDCGGLGTEIVARCKQNSERFLRCAEEEIQTARETVTAMGERENMEDSKRQEVLRLLVSSAEMRKAKAEAFRKSEGKALSRLAVLMAVERSAWRAERVLQQRSKEERRKRRRLKELGGLYARATKCVGKLLLLRDSKKEGVSVKPGSDTGRNLRKIILGLNPPPTPQDEKRPRDL